MVIFRALLFLRPRSRHEVRHVQGSEELFPADLLPDCISRCVNYANATLQPTCRNCDVPYKEGNFTIIVDGFLVTANVTCERVENYYTAFTYSDHCPVAMQFKLN